MKRREFIGCLSATIASGVVAGCSMFEHDTRPTNDSDATFWSKMFHRPSQKRDSFFFNEKSREIEQHLDGARPTSLP